MITKEAYEVGALLYAPALKTTVASHIIENAFGKCFSMAFCLEDTVADDAVEAAEQQLKKTLSDIYDARKQNIDFYLPKIFIRVREAAQILKLYNLLEDKMQIVTGFILPKFNKDNGSKYIKSIRIVNKRSKKKIYAMPILESSDLIDPSKRMDNLLKIKNLIDTMNEYVLNVRVGGNDFSNQFAVRRKVNETIYDILPIAELLSDILAMFSREYVVSGPVWEYFSGEKWKKGMKKELEKDITSGFIGKTVIHPKQIKIVNDALMVSRKDYDDAKQISGWKDSDSDGFDVAKSVDGGRMNEVRTHGNWAKKIIMLAEIYGLD